MQGLPVLSKSLVSKARTGKAEEENGARENTGQRSFQDLGTSGRKKCVRSCSDGKSET